MEFAEIVGTDTTHGYRSSVEGVEGAGGAVVARGVERTRVASWESAVRGAVENGAVFT